VVVRLVFPALHASTIDVRRESELFVTRRSDLDSIAVRERGCEVDYRQVDQRVYLAPERSSRTLLIRVGGVQLIHP
jgi:hypothetical protein